MTVVKRFDSGLNLKHRDVVKKLWRNTAEIPGIGVDDDFNGFVDDVHGFDALTSAGFTSSPIISSNWNHPGGDGWIVPVGGGLGYAFRLANQPTQISLEGYYNAVKPTFAGEELLGDWTIRTQVQVLFPK